MLSTSSDALGGGLVRTGPSINRGRSKQDVGTPADFIEAVERRFGRITFDLAASAENTKGPAFFTKEDDTLIQTWPLAGVNWLNPEFSDIAPYARKCAVVAEVHAGLILLLTPASIGANWFADHVNGKAYVLGLSPRLTFEGSTDPYPKDLMLSVYGYGFRGFDTWRWK